MESQIIEKKICLESKFLDKNIMKNLFLKLSELTNDNCSKEYGFIIKINKLIEIVDHKIGRANIDNIFHVKFEASVLKPRKDVIVQGKVVMIYEDGIFISILNRQNMLIPRSKLNNYNFQKDKTSYIHNNTGNTITINSIIKAKIITAIYNNNSYSCFGYIV